MVVTGVSDGPGSFTIEYDSGGVPVNIDVFDAPSDNLLNTIPGVMASPHTITGADAPAGSSFYRVYIP